MLRQLLLCSALLSLHCASAVPQVHYSGGTISPFRSQSSQPSISAEAITVTLASLLSVKSPVPVEPSVAQQVPTAVQPRSRLLYEAQVLFDQG